MGQCNRTGLAFVVAPSYEAMSEHAAALITSEIRRQPNLLLCAASGSSPTRTYQLLGEVASNNPLLVRQLRILKLDEWGGLGMADPASCENYLKQMLLRPLGIAPERYQGFNSEAKNPEAECDRVSQWLAQHGPIDLCVLGVGTNGHLALNEPAEALCPGAHVARLAASSLRHSMLAVSSAKPAHGVTLGMGDILQSKKIVVLLNGAHKCEVLKRLQKPRITPEFPASFLWLHPHVTVFCDSAAAEKAPEFSTL